MYIHIVHILSYVAIRYLQPKFNTMLNVGLDILVFTTIMS